MQTKHFPWDILQTQQMKNYLAGVMYICINKAQEEQQGIFTCCVWGNQTLATLFVNKIAQLCYPLWWFWFCFGFCFISVSTKQVSEWMKKLEAVMKFSRFLLGNLSWLCPAYFPEFWSPRISCWRVGIFFWFLPGQSSLAWKDRAVCGAHTHKHTQTPSTVTLLPPVSLFQERKTLILHSSFSFLACL